MNSQPAIANTEDTTDFIAGNCLIGEFPKRHNTVIAEVLAHLLDCQNLTGMDAVFNASTTRLSAHIFELRTKYNWPIEDADIATGTSDGRVAHISTYFLSNATVRRANKDGALEFRRSVKEARAKARSQAAKASAAAKKRNVARLVVKFDPNQQVLFSGGACE